MSIWFIPNRWISARARSASSGVERDRAAAPKIVRVLRWPVRPKGWVGIDIRRLLETRASYRRRVPSHPKTGDLSSPGGEKDRLGRGVDRLAPRYLRNGGSRLGVAPPRAVAVGYKINGPKGRAQGSASCTLETLVRRDRSSPRCKRGWLP